MSRMSRERHPGRRWGASVAAAVALATVAHALPAQTLTDPETPVRERPAPAPAPIPLEAATPGAMSESWRGALSREGALEAAAAGVDARTGQAAVRPSGGPGRWLMIGGSALMAAALGDYLTDGAGPGLSTRGVALYGSGIALFGVGAWQATRAPASPVMATRDTR